jgi:hypothetical protein
LRFQLLGPVQAEGGARWARQAALRIRAALIQADAVIGVEDERISKFGKTVRRISGTAVRAVEPAGKSELQSRWFDESVMRVTNHMLWLLAVSFCYRGIGLTFVLGGSWVEQQMATLPGSGGAHGPLSWLPGAATLDGLMAKLGFEAVWVATILWLGLYHLWPALLTFLLRRLRWPQLVPAAALIFLTHQAIFMLGPAVEMMKGAFTGDFWRFWHMFLLLLVGVENWAFLFFGFLVASRLRRTQRIFRRGLEKGEENLSLVRVWLGRLSLAASLIVIAFWSVFFGSDGLQALASRAGSGASPKQVKYEPVTNDLPDIGVSWVLDSGWQEEAAAARPGAHHLFRSKDVLFATAEVRDSQALPQELQGDSQQLLGRSQEESFRSLVHPQVSGVARAVQSDGLDWLELEFNAAFSIRPNLEIHFLLRARADRARQATLVVGCPLAAWGQFKDRARAATDGFHLGTRQPGRQFEPPAAGTSLNPYRGTKQPYLCRLPGTWQRQFAPAPSDLFLMRGKDLVFSVVLEPLPAVGTEFITLVQAEGLALQMLRQSPQFDLLGSEEVQLGGRPGRLLRVRYRAQQDQSVITEYRVLAAHSGWLYQVRALTTNPDRDLPLLEGLLAGVQFP